MIHCQHVQVDWGLSRPAEFTLTVRWTECVPISHLLCSEEVENTRIFSSRSLAKSRAFLTFSSAQEGFLRNWIVDYIFTRQYVCISTLRLDETSVYLENLWPLWRVPTCRFPLQLFISPKRYMPNLWPKHPSVLYVRQYYSPEVKLAEPEVHHSVPSVAEVKNEKSCTFFLPYAFMAFCKIEQRLSVISCWVT